jgi:hypothetical protein
MADMVAGKLSDDDTSSNLRKKKPLHSEPQTHTPSEGMFFRRVGNLGLRFEDDRGASVRGRG